MTIAIRRSQPFAGCLLSCFISGPLTALAQTPPSAGSLLQQLQPPLAVPPAAAPELALPRAVAAPASGGPKVAVRAYRLAGIDATQAAELQPLLQKYVGEGKTLADMEDAAKDVEVALQRRGLFLAQVYLPEQTLADGSVTLQVLEGRIGAVTLQIDPGVKVSPELMDKVVERLRGNPVARRTLIESALFVLGDLRGIAVQSSLTPGDKVGQADLTIEVKPGAATATTVEFENGGSLYTGRYRFNGSFDWYNPLGRGDVASLRALVSTNWGTRFVRGSWLTPVNVYGTKVGVAASLLEYSLGSALFEPLDAKGSGAALSLQALHPLVRSRNNNLFLQLSGDVRRFEDKVQSISLVTKKGMTSYVTVGAVGDFRDTLGGGGISNYAANVVTGRLKIDTPNDLAADQSAAGYRSAGRYSKLTASASRLQVLPNKDFLYLNAVAQAASKNLDSSEKFSLGGPNGVRAYPASESPSDSAVLLGWEYRKPLRFESIDGDFIVSLFGDYAVARQHETPLPTDIDNRRKLVGHGVGLTFADSKGLLLRGWIALRGSTKAQSDDSRARLYVQASKQF